MIMELFKFSLNQATWTLQVDISLVLIIGIVLLALFFWLIYLRFVKKGLRPLSEFEINEAEIGIGNQRLILRPNHHDLQIAYQLWAELATRKIGLPIDEDHDLIIDIYSSWYHFFCGTRELIKNIPAQQAKSKEGTRELIDTALKILNDEMRPHLTRWQAYYRHWWTSACGDDVSAKHSPQVIQKTFPDYSALMSDLIQVNHKLVKYKETLREIVYS
jgi:hypothetical protein